MKNFLTILACIIITATSVFASRIKLTPARIDFHGVESKDNFIIAYGNFGSALLSWNNAKDWTQIKLFENDIIVKVFIQGDKLIAFGCEGGIKISPDKGLNWIEAAKLQDSILAAIESPNGYIVRTTNKIISLSSDFNIIKTVEIPHFNIFYMNKPNYISFYMINSITQYLDGFALISDSSIVSRYDFNLNKIDELDFEGQIGSEFTNYFKIASLGEDIYIVLSRNYYKISKMKTISKFCDYKLKTPNDSGYVVILKAIDDKLYMLTRSYNFKISNVQSFNLYQVNEQGELLFKDNFSASNSYTEMSLTAFQSGGNYADIALDNLNLIMVNSGKSIVFRDIHENITWIRSDAPLQDSYMPMPDQIGDSSYIFHTSWGVYKTTDNGATYEHLTQDRAFTKDDTVASFKKFTDSKANIIRHGFRSVNNEPITYDYYAALSYNDGKTWSNKRLTSFEYQEFSWRDFGETLDGHYFLWFTGYMSFYNENLDIVKKTSLHKYPYKAHAINMDTIALVTIKTGMTFEDTSDVFPLIYTKDGGNNYDTLKVFGCYKNFAPRVTHINPVADYFEIKGKHYWLLSNPKTLDSLRSRFTIDALDLLTGEVRNVLTQEYNFNRNTIPHICEYKDTLYVVIEDSLHIMPDIFDAGTWRSYCFPDSGRIKGQNGIVKFKDKFFVNYSDKKHPMKYYWLEFLDEPVGTEEQAYNADADLYASPAYPNPARDKVEFDIYFKHNYDLNIEDISIFDISGNRIKAKFEYRNLNSFSGTLLLDCSGLPSGSYFVKFKAQEGEYSVKFAVVK